MIRKAPLVLPALLLAGVVLPTDAGAQQTQQSQTTGYASDPGFYIRAGTGYSTSFEDEIEYSPLWHLGLGYRLNDTWRVDITADWRDRFLVEGARPVIAGGVVTPVDSQVSNQAYMVNAYYDVRGLPVLRFPRGFRPYVGVGVGFSTIEVDDSTVFVDRPDDDIGDEVLNFLGDDDDQFAWQVMIGAAYNFTDNAFFDVSYRFADLGDVQLASAEGSIDEDLNAHEILLTLGYRF